MQTGDNDRGVNQPEDEAANWTAVCVQPQETLGKTVSNDSHERTNNDEGKEPGDDHCNQRGNQEVGGALEALVQPLLNGCQQPGNSNHWDDLPLVADLGDGEPEQLPGLHASSSGHIDLGVGVDQFGRNHGGAHRGAEVGVATKTFDGREADQYGQGGERRGGNQLDQRRIVGEPRPQLNQRLGSKQTLSGHDVVEGHHEAAGYQRGKHRHENVGDSLDET